MTGRSGETPHRGSDDLAHDAVARLGLRARRRNVERTARVAALLASGRKAPDAAARDEAAMLCHTVAGSAGTFGDDELTGAARSLEAALRAGRDDDVPDALEHLRTVVRREPSSSRG